MLATHLVAVSLVVAGCASRQPAPAPVFVETEGPAFAVESIGALELLAEQVETVEVDGGLSEVLAADEPPEDRLILAALRDRDILAHSAARGVVITLPDVLFEFGSASLTADGRRRTRDAAAVLLGEGRGRLVSVEGHTDSIGAELFNQGLSERRSASIARALVGAGVPEAIVKIEGYGSRYPIAPNSQPDGSDNPDGRAKNRRVELVIER